MKPNVSVIIATYNNADTIRDSVLSVLGQDYPEMEVIAVNDNSTDHTGEVLDQLAAVDGRLAVIHNPRNLGVAASRNLASRKASGKYLAPQDGDDVWVGEGRLSRQMLFLEGNQDHVLVGGWGEATDYGLNRLYDIQLPLSDEAIRKRMLFECSFLHSCVAYRKDAFDQVGGYDESLKSTVDYDLYAKLGLLGKMANIPEIFFKYRQNPKGITGTSARKQLDNAIGVVRAHKNDYPGYVRAILMWQARKLYPSWLKGKWSWRIKNLLNTRA